jgi:peptidoglycan/xylan/chitin deacetylase (PgdA/CDA1 family)
MNHARAGGVASFGYHDVTDAPASSGFQRTAAAPFKLTRASFARHLDAIAQTRAPELIDAIDPAAHGQHVLLTFDDGGHSALYTAEELVRRGWRGHFFVITSRIGEPGFLTAQQVRQLSDDGHVIGSHTHTHPSFFRELSWDRITEEWRTSVDHLAQLLGQPVLSASVPGGDLSDRVVWSAIESGIRFLFTSEPTTEPDRVDATWVLGRYVAKVSTSPSRIRELARFQGWYRAMAWRQLKLSVRSLLPGFYHRYVRSRTLEPSSISC